MSRSPELVSGPALASQIARVCAQAGVSPTRFGKQALKDPGLFIDLKSGRELGPKTLARVHEALAAVEAGDAALGTRPCGRPLRGAPLSVKAKELCAALLVPRLLPKVLVAHLSY